MSQLYQPILDTALQERLEFRFKALCLSTNDQWVVSLDEASYLVNYFFGPGIAKAILN